MDGLDPPPISSLQPSVRYTDGRVARVSRLGSLVCLWVAGLGLCAMTLIILWQVFARYVLNASPAWSEQLALYILVWAVLFAAAAGVREKFHIRITAVQDAVGPGLRSTMQLISHSVTALLGIFMVVYGAELVRALWVYDIPTLGVPRGSAFLPLPFAGLLIALFSAEHIAAQIRNREVLPLWR